VPRLGPHRLRFQLECAAALQRQLRALHSDLIFAVGRPEELLPLLAQRLAGGADGVRHVQLYHQQEPLSESAALEDLVLQRLQAAAAGAGGSAGGSSYWGAWRATPRDALLAARH
jgi:deoxyribodipyrimidine photolyase